MNYIIPPTYVIGGAADRALLLALEVELGGQAEVAELELHLLVEEQVAELQVAVDHAVGVQVLQRVDDLHDVALHLDLPLAASCASPAQRASARRLLHSKTHTHLIGAHFQQDVHVFPILEYVFELDDIRMVQGFVDADLGDEFLLRAVLGQRVLCDDLRRVGALGLEVHDFVALREAALAQQSFSALAPDGHFAA